nr:MULTISPECIES: hypothetical protein [Parafrankia]
MRARSAMVGSEREDGMTVCGLLRLDGADVRRSELTGMLAASSIGLPAARRVHLDGSFGVVTAADDAVGSMPPVLVGPAGLVIVIVHHGAGARVVRVGRAGGARAAAPTSQAGAATGPFRTAGSIGGVGPPGRRAASDGSDGSSAGTGSVTVLRPAGLRPVGLRPADAGESLPAVDAADAAGGVDAGAPWREPTGDGAWDERTHGVRAADALMASYRAAGQRALGTLDEHLLAIVWEPTRRRLIVSRGGRRADDLVVWSDGRYFAFGAEPGQVLAVGSLGSVRPRRLAAGETLPVTVATRLRRPPATDFLPQGAESAVLDSPVT